MLKNLQVVAICFLVGSAVAGPVKKKFLDSGIDLDQFGGLLPDELLPPDPFSSLVLDGCRRCCGPHPCCNEPFDCLHLGGHNIPLDLSNLLLHISTTPESGSPEH
ncbi:hypothetical protein ACJMK2_011385 [Sinanodonta woodiana]|uniref:Uncharacterized protein n=1 Tax=Sinanodonta woodiana TaxID=1069815 RepID=A0ABD3V809_SINWO